ncbi:carboxypeptidase-like regulatory domain-containing protein [Aquimarina sp. D1M17]|uniref:carboxypeptidase-like regulatory domain-containing protein n=1 Tax=Aquimarina acroporae TaxID=2937283 RepID=UPI0020BD60EF|nr:carboxypeptidase-like regulatory domain-containing protein [Aquimarina acroporae]MCK8521056.1 carboxypeptidase-like regulatory domain-containing protein [Aquimarina acroporae]
MEKIIFILIILTFNLTLSQSTESEFEFRQLTGTLFDEYGKAFPAQNVIVLGTSIGTQTDFDGKFCLIVPKNKTVYIAFPFCFDQITREVGITDSHFDLKIGRGKRKSRKATQNWNLEMEKLKVELNKIYNSKEYKTAEKNICG